MKNQDNHGREPPESIGRSLRQEAEELAREKESCPSKNFETMTPEETRRNLHELLVHQIELEMQNDELRQAQVELEDARARYLDLYDMAPVGYCTISEKGLILEINLTAANLLGVTRGALINKPLSRFIFKEDQDIYYLHRRQIFKSGEPQAYDLRMTKRDRMMFWVHLDAICPDTGRIPVCRIALSDITDRKQAENKLRESENHARELVSELEKADKNKNDFISILSHEIRNPLAVIMAGVSLLGLTDDAEKVGNAKVSMERQTIQLCRLVDDLMDLTRINTNKVKLKKERVELYKLVTTVVEDYRAQFEEKGVRLETKIPSKPLYLEADPTRLAQILGNLLHNAIKFTETGGTTLLTVTKQKDQAVICVKDSGIGIEPEILPDIFQPFVQQDNSLDRSNSGLGLGLAVVKGMAELHGGSVSVFSEGLGRGTQFTVCLPLFPEEANQQRDKPSGGRPSRLFRILFIEDNIDLTDILCSMLAQFGHEAVSERSGIDGIAKAKEFMPDIIFCDIGLPGMSGYEVARSIKSDNSFTGVFMVALTGYAGPRDIECAMNAGFDRHISKPVDIAALNWILSEVPK